VILEKVDRTVRPRLISQNPGHAVFPVYSYLHCRRS